MRIVLASESPRRYELLKMIGIENFAVIPAEVEETASSGMTPEQTVCDIALRKAKSVSRSCGPDDIIIAADTLVYLDGRPLAKPCDEADAASMLRALSGRRHTVYTGVVLLRGNDNAMGAEKTEVFFRELQDSEIIAYISTGEPMDKAGAYGAQGRGAVFIERLEGDFFNVMGLPICKLSTMLKDFGVIHYHEGL